MYFIQELAALIYTSYVPDMKFLSPTCILALDPLMLGASLSTLLWPLPLPTLLCFFLKHANFIPTPGPFHSLFFLLWMNLHTHCTETSSRLNFHLIQKAFCTLICISIPVFPFLLFAYVCSLQKYHQLALRDVACVYCLSHPTWMRALCEQGPDRTDNIQHLELVPADKWSHNSYRLNKCKWFQSWVFPLSVSRISIFSLM